MNGLPPQLLGLPRYASGEEAIARERPAEPMYVLWPERFRRAAERFLTGFAGDTCYAVKSNPHPYVLDLLWESGIRHFDTASLHEIKLVRTRFPEAHCHFMAPIRPAGAAKLAFTKYGVTDYAVDCDVELDKLLGETGGSKRLRIFVRLATAPGGAVVDLSAKFGATPDDAARLLRRVADAGSVPALTFHVGSQCLSPPAYAQAVDLARSTVQAAGVELAVLDLGGGFPAPYAKLDLPPYPVYFDAIRRATKALPTQVQLMCEPGRALSAEGVSLIAQVILRKQDRLYINDGVYGSFSELTLPGWISDYPVQAFLVDDHGGVKPRLGRLRTFQVYGPTCDSHDKLPRPLHLPDDIDPGDFLLFDAIGAYSIALRTHFNGYLPDRWAVAGS